MSTIILLVLLGGCLVMHFFMMRKHGHEGDHENMKAKEKDGDHSGHGCCH